jgi:aminopeptidase N
VFANANDYAYALVLPDTASTHWLEQHIGTVDDGFLRAMLWGALWDLVRETRMAPGRFLAAAMRELANEYDDQIAAGIVGRVRRGIEAYLSAADRDALLPDAERLFLRLATNPARSYGIRRTALDAYIDVATTPAALAQLDAWLDSSNAAGLPLRQPSRWTIVTHLVSVASPTAERRFAEEQRRDTTAGGQRRAFVAGAARPDSATKRSYFTRYFADSALNEEWVTASLRAFNDPEQSALTIRYLAPALDSLPWIQRNRRIFFLGSWLGAFIGGQHDSSALRLIDEYLAEHPKLAMDLRQKILQTRDELERTVRIRRAFPGPNERPPATSPGPSTTQRDRSRPPAPPRQ